MIAIKVEADGNDALKVMKALGKIEPQRVAVVMIVGPVTEQEK